jgi:outer membrane biosynthesis protein TonB
VTNGYAIGDGEGRRRRFRRTLIFSTVGHALLLLGLVGSVPGKRSVVLPSVITVDLVAAPAPAPAPAPAAPRPAPKPAPKQVVLPERPNTPQPKPRRRKEVVLEQKPKEEKSLEDLLQQFREESGEPKPKPEPVASAAGEEVVARAPAGGIPVSAEKMQWMRAARIRVMENWVVPAEFRLQALQTEVRVALDDSGEVIGTPRIVRHSGNPWYDKGVVRSIQKASPLPPPPEPGDWTFIFDSDDSY